MFNILVIISYSLLVFIDATWQQSKVIARDVRISKLKRIKITKQLTLFWRYQEYGEEFLATIEAIYFTLREFMATVSGSYDGEVDDLLFYYIFLYNKIQDKYQKEDIPFHRKQGWKRDREEK
jgi:DTW domain-containing protein YfiP